jgi:ribosomal protein L12E/L44/L45/RPP1/RPP2
VKLQVFALPQTQSVESRIMDEGKKALLEQLAADIKELIEAARRALDAAAEATSEAKRTACQAEAEEYLRLIKRRERQIERLLEDHHEPDFREAAHCAVLSAESGSVMRGYSYSEAAMGSCAAAFAGRAKRVNQPADDGNCCGACDPAAGQDQV